MNAVIYRQVCIDKNHNYSNIDKIPTNGIRQTILTVCEDINDLNYILIMDVLFIKIGDNYSTENNGT